MAVIAIPLLMRPSQLVCGKWDGLGALVMPRTLVPFAGALRRSLIQQLTRVIFATAAYGSGDAAVAAANGGVHAVQSPLTIREGVTHD